MIVLPELLNEVDRVRDIELPGDILQKLNNYSISDLATCLDMMYIPKYIANVLRAIFLCIDNIERQCTDCDIMYALVKQYIVQVYRQLWLRDDFNSKLYYRNWENAFLEFIS